MNVSQTYIHQRRQALMHSGNVLQDGNGVLDRQVKNVGDGITVELHRQGLLVVAPPVADLAKHVHIGQEIHLDAALALALARLAPSTLHIEAEAPRLVAALSAIGQHGKQIADGCEHAGIGGRVRTRGPADRRLIDLDHLVELVGPMHRLMCPRLLAGFVQLARQRAVQDVVDKRGLTRPRDAGHHRHHAHRKVRRNVLQIMRGGVLNREPAAIQRPRRLVRRRPGHDVDLPREVSTRDGRRIGHDLGGRARSHQLAAVFARARPQVEHVVGLADRIFVVLHHQYGIAQVPQVFQRLDQPLIVTLVQADGRLVEHIKNASQARSDLGGQPDALALAAGERGRRAAQRQVAQPHRVQKLKPLNHLALQSIGYEPVPAGEVHGARRRQRPLQREPSEVGDGHITSRVGALRRLGVIFLLVHGRVQGCRGHGQRHRQRLRTEPRAMAGGALGGRHKAHHVLAIGLGLRLLHVVAQVAEDAMKAEPGTFGAGRPVQQQILMLLRQILERLLQIDLELFSCKLYRPQEILRGRARPKRPIQQRLGPVRDHTGGVEIEDGAQAVAGRAGAIRGVERERSRLQLGHIDPAVRAGHGGGKQRFGVLAAGGLQAHQDQSAAELQRRGDSVGQALGVKEWTSCLVRFRQGLQDDAVDDRLDRMIFTLLQPHPLFDLGDLTVDPNAVALAVERL